LVGIGSRKCCVLLLLLVSLLLHAPSCPLLVVVLPRKVIWIICRDLAIVLIFVVLVPDGFKYTKSHEWLKVSGTTGTVGITDYAQSAVSLANRHLLKFDNSLTTTW
jgi:hypothetical protein